MIEFILPTTTKVIATAIIFMAILLHDHIADRIINKLTGYFIHGLKSANIEIYSKIDEVFDNEEIFDKNDMNIIYATTFFIRCFFAYICSCLIMLL
jgi:hypothetical protein